MVITAEITSRFWWNFHRNIVYMLYIMFMYKYSVSSYENYVSVPKNIMYIIYIAHHIYAYPYITVQLSSLLYYFYPLCLINIINHVAATVIPISAKISKDDLLYANVPTLRLTALILILDRWKQCIKFYFL